MRIFCGFCPGYSVAHPSALWCRSQVHRQLVRITQTVRCGRAFCRFPWVPGDGNRRSGRVAAQKKWLPGVTSGYQELPWKRLRLLKVSWPVSQGRVKDDGDGGRQDTPPTGCYTVTNRMDIGRSSLLTRYNRINIGRDWGPIFKTFEIIGVFEGWFCGKPVTRVLQASYEVLRGGESHQSSIISHQSSG